MNKKPKKHSCDSVITKDSWAMSGYRQTGDKWKCSCGKKYVHVEDEAEGSSWVLSK
jgi:hypothetical protein